MIAQKEPIILRNQTFLLFAGLLVCCSAVFNFSTIRVLAANTTEEEIKRLEAAIFGEFSPSSMPEETLERLLRLNALMGPSGRSDLERLLGFREILATDCSSADDVDAVRNKIDYHYQQKSPNVVLYLKNLLVRYYAHCAALVRNTILASVSHQERSKVSELNRRANKALGFGEATRNQGHAKHSRSIRFNTRLAEAVLGFMKHKGAFPSWELRRRDEEHFQAKFDAYVGDACRCLRLSVQFAASAISHCPDLEYLVLVDPQTWDWVESYETCGKILTNYSRIYQLFKEQENTKHTGALTGMRQWLNGCFRRRTQVHPRHRRD